MTHDINNDDLDWLAFCYAAGDLDAAQAEHFESRLAEEQPAREALARAVELCQTVTAAEIQCAEYVTPAAHHRVEWNQRLSWMAVGGLASLLLALLWTGVIGPTWQTAQRNHQSFSKRNLAFAWNETRTEIAGVREAGYWPSTFSDDADDEITSDSELDEMLGDAPSWMTAAVFGLPSDNTATESGHNSRLEN